MELSKYIDHTLLKATATEEEIFNLCAEANKYKFKSVCVNPCYVNFCRDALAGSGVDVCTVIGFPLGANATEVKAFEATKAIADGADEIDMVINVGLAKMHDYEAVYNDIKAVADACNGVLLKVIIETCYLTDEEKVEVCKMAKLAGADFVKTSTGFGTAGATEADVKLMRQTVGDEMGVKASGGIRTKDDFLKMINAGASRIGCSAGVKIMEELENE